jgi:hypothetical protein
MRWRDWPRTHVRVGNRMLHSFHLAGAGGIVAGTGLGLWLAAVTGGSVATVGLLSVLSVGVLLALALVAQVLLGRDALVAYHHLVAILGVAATTLWLIGRPVLVHLDLVMVGVGTTLAFGRLGCFLVGCCHGLPSGHGVAYGPDHVRDGFPAGLVGVPLFPLPLVESAVWVVLVSVGVALRFVAPAGVALATILVGYAIARFALESRRGDAGRPEVLGWSEARWWSVTSLLAVVAGLLANRDWPVLRLAAVVGAAALVVVGWRLGAQPVPASTARLLRDLVAGLAVAERGEGTTVGAGGLVVSSERVLSPEGDVLVHSVSRPSPPLSRAEVDRLAAWMVHLRRPGRAPWWQRCTAEGVLQVVVPLGPPTPVSEGAPP